MTLRKVCTALGVSRRAVQGYENESLVTATGKNNRGYLLYDSEAQERIKKIKLYQDMGFSLKQIKEIIDDSGSVLRNALIQQKEKLNQEIEKTHMIHIIQEIRAPHRMYRPIMTTVPWKAFEKESKVIFPTPFRKSPKNLKKQILLLDIAMKSISRTNNCSQTGIHLQYQRKMLCLKEP